MSLRTKDHLSKATLYATLNALKRPFIWLAGQPGYKSKISHSDAETASRPITGINLSTGAPYSANAYGDGTHDDKSVLQTALNTCGLIKVPAGTYILSGTLTIPSIDGAGIIGDGAGLLSEQSSSGGTVFKASFARGDIIHCPTHLTHATFRGFVLDRSVTATSGSGLNTSISSDGAVIDDVWSLHSYVGFTFSTCGYGVISNCRASSNVSHGFSIVGQWQTSKCYSNSNGGCGFYVAGQLSPNGNSLGQYTGLSTYANSSHGIYFDGSSLAVHDIRLSDSFFGGDGGHGVYDDSYSSGPNTYTNVFVESEADGFHITANTNAVQFVNCTATGNTQNGLKSWSPVTLVSGGTFSGHSATNSYGVWFVQGKGSIIGANITGNWRGVGGSVGVTAMTCLGNRCSGNASMDFDTSAASNVTLYANY